ncbi:S8/S53 family peptidase [Rothia mucilaginosa]|uniref:S8 family peptidase n=1 Tax=Rothia mucilaginosa TaxID=43675 RepID=UPI0026F089E3|nr:S8/S53 family peptidase [Rothia mucilaginosa]
MTPRPDAPYRPRLFVGAAGRAARALTTAACALALSVGVLAVSPSSARADDTITTQDYVSYYKLDQARAKGYTGKGVTIAMIDGTVDTSVPELAGANITVKTPCPYKEDNASKTHATAIASILVSKNYGLAADATLIAYSVPTKQATTSDECKQDRSGLKGTPSGAIEMALNDGAQIISISRSDNSKDSKAQKWAITRAMARGVIIVGPMGNDAKDENEVSYARWSGTVGVSAIDASGQLASYSSWGQGVVAAGIGGPVKARDYDTSTIKDMEGTSFATPVVAGQIALARSRWPQATPNQILQLVTHSGSNNGAWNQYTGYGALSLDALLGSDPSQYPDENPLADKGGGSMPTPAEVQQYVDGLVPSLDIVLDDSYVYRGVDEDAAGDDTVAAHIGTSPAYHRK